MTYDWRPLDVQRPAAGVMGARVELAPGLVVIERGAARADALEAPEEHAA